MELDGKQYALRLLRRGRNKSAPPQLRLNNYRDENGQYQLSDGLQPWHERVVDFMISHPHAKIKELAEFFGVSPQWMGMLIKTDAFITYKNARMQDHQENVSSEIVTKMQAVAVKSLEQLDKVLDNEPSFSQVRDAASMALKGLGYTDNKNGPNVVVNPAGEGNTTVVVQTSTIARAREKWVENLNDVPEQGGGKEDYEYVTAAKMVEIEDAVMLDDDDSSDEDAQEI